MTIAPPAFPTIAGGIAYLDSAATSQTPEPVLEAMDAYYREYRASVHRGVYGIAARATEEFEGARVKAAALTGSTPKETIFTRNATEAINLVAYSWGSMALREGDLIVVTEMEHHSNLVPWQLAAQRAGATLAYVGVDDEGRLIDAELDALLERAPKLVAVTHASNVVGTINDIADITRRAHAAGARVMVDGSQAVPHIPVTVGDVDFYAWTGHKAYGPTGIGVLHGKAELLDAMPPFLGGGHMITKVSEQTSTYMEAPAKFEAGTSNIAEAIGLGAACDFLTGIGLDAVAAHNRDIGAYALERLDEVPGLTIHGPKDAESRIALVSFALDGVHPHDVAEILGAQGVCVRAGHHCAQPLMRRLGVPASSRASFAIHSSREDVDRLVDGLGRVREIFA
jgi:cysteine desulfurase/selenocysteine lyase